MNRLAASESETYTEVIRNALAKPSGARFYRCALQVNPFEYVARHSSSTEFQTDEQYNDAIVEACKKSKVNVIAVTDHYRVKHSASLLEAARKAGIHALPGFEAVTKDGVHFLCIFDKNKQQETLERVIGDCGITKTSEKSPIGKLDATELLDEAKNWGALCIAAHVASKGGLLKVLKGQPGIKAWQHDNLLACAIPGMISDAPDGIRQILENKDDQYRRKREVAVINASDVSAPSALHEGKSFSQLKMSSVSTEGLRQAFLDPDSRVRLGEKADRRSGVELTAIAWEGGFLNGVSIHMNSELNTLIGGRGVGKSTIIESIRYAFNLDVTGDDAKKQHEQMIRDVLRAGTKISVSVLSHTPSEMGYVIERTVPNPPVVRDCAGKILPLLPSDIAANIAVFGQHEISELANSPRYLTRLLDQFIEERDGLPERKIELRSALRKSRMNIVNICNDRAHMMEQLEALPGLEEMQQRYQTSGLEDRLKEKSCMVREERVWSVLDERLNEYRALKEEIDGMLPVDTAFVEPAALKGLLNTESLSKIKEVLDELTRGLTISSEKISQSIQQADGQIKKILDQWKQRQSAVNERYEQALRNLQGAASDGAEFIEIRKKIEMLKPLDGKRRQIDRDYDENMKVRKNLIAEWKSLQAEEYRQIESAAKRVNKILQKRARVRVKMAGDRGELIKHVKELSGRTDAIEFCLSALDQLSLGELSVACQEGSDALKEKYGFTKAAASKLESAELDWKLKIEELMMLTQTEIELNISNRSQEEVWRETKGLSVGQRATAVLLLVLLESDSPLIIDQPEDDLDNRFISESVVPIMKSGKRARQFLVSTHNANIPVLGDSEQIIALDTVLEEGSTEMQAEVVEEKTGSIDEEKVREVVEEILEGGREAFETRRRKYGF